MLNNAHPNIRKRIRAYKKQESLILNLLTFN